MSDLTTEVRDELLAAIRTQTDAAAKTLPREGAAALRDLAEAYCAVTAAAPAPDPESAFDPPVGEYQLSTR